LEVERERVADGVPRPLGRASLSSSLAEEADESSLSAAEEGEFLAARFTRDRPDLVVPLPPAGVPFLRTPVLEGVPALRARSASAPLDVARGPALPAR
jgi:hypothetical protein